MALSSLPLTVSLAGSSQDFESPPVVSPTSLSTPETAKPPASAAMAAEGGGEEGEEGEEVEEGDSGEAGSSSGTLSSSTSQAPLPHGSKVFVGQVPKTYMESHLRPLFERYGPVMDVMVLRDRLSGSHKGKKQTYTYVTLETHGLSCCYGDYLLVTYPLPTPRRVFGVVFFGFGRDRRLAVVWVMK